MTTLGCHLCEQAEQLLTALQADGLEMDIVPVEIANDEELMDRYGIRIPVVRMSDRELGWPFNLETLQGFLTAE